MCTLLHCSNVAVQCNCGCCRSLSTVMLLRQVAARSKHVSPMRNNPHSDSAYSTWKHLEAWQHEKNHASCQIRWAHQLEALGPWCRDLYMVILKRRKIKLLGRSNCTHLLIVQYYCACVTASGSVDELLFCESQSLPVEPGSLSAVSPPPSPELPQWS